MGFAWTIIFRDHDFIHNDSRRMMRKGLASTAIPHYHNLIETMAHKFLGEIANRALDISDVMQPYVIHRISSCSYVSRRRHMAHITLTVGYGEKVIQKHGEHLTKANKHALITTTSALAQFWFVDVFPFCEWSLLL
jgi:hypothetical protein